MHKKITLLLTLAIILISTPLIFAQTLEVKLQIDGLNPVEETDSYEGYEFQYTSFTDYSVTLLGLIKYPISQEHSFGFGEFSAKLTTSNGKELSRSKFHPVFFIFSDPPEETNSELITLNFPYSNQAQYLEVYHNNNQKLKVNIKELLCNQDSVCNENENYLSCQEDCLLYSQDGLCNGYGGDNYCDTDCYTDSDCNQENCNDNIQNQDETGIDQGGVCAEEDCTLKELSGEITCGDNVCSPCEDTFSCARDCTTEGDACPPDFFKIETVCKSKSERITDWKQKRITIKTLMKDIRNSILPSL